MKKILIFLILFFILGFLGWYIWGRVHTEKYVATAENTASYECKDRKTIRAVFAESGVSLTLSDGRMFTLADSVSASGARYANQDDSVVFWTHGYEAFFEEGDEVTFEGCKTTAGQ